MTNPFIVGSQIYLRAPEPGDEQIYALSQNHPEPRENLFFALPTPLSHHQKTIEDLNIDHHTIQMTICTKSPDAVIGNTALFRIDWVGRMAIYYIAIAESQNWSKGYGQEATKLMVNYAFATLNLNRLQLHVFTENKRAVETYKKNGFIIEGTLRQAMFHHNTYCDFYVMGILKEDWQKQK